MTRVVGNVDPPESLLTEWRRFRNLQGFFVCRESTRKEVDLWSTLERWEDCPRFLNILFKDNANFWAAFEKIMKSLKFLRTVCSSRTPQNSTVSRKSSTCPKKDIRSLGTLDGKWNVDVLDAVLLHATIYYEIVLPLSPAQRSQQQPKLNK